MNPSQPDWLGITPLHQFAEQGAIENAVIFLDHGADLHARDEDICSTPLGWAAKFGNNRWSNSCCDAAPGQPARTIRRGPRRWPGRRAAGTGRLLSC